VVNFYPVFFSSDFFCVGNAWQLNPGSCLCTPAVSVDWPYFWQYSLSCSNIAHTLQWLCIECAGILAQKKVVVYNGRGCVHEIKFFHISPKEFYSMGGCIIKMSHSCFREWAELTVNHGSGPWLVEEWVCSEIFSSAHGRFWARSIHRKDSW